MKQITNKEYEEFQRYQRDKMQGKILTPDGLRFIIEANEYDAQKIRQHFLDMLPKIREWKRRSMSDGCRNAAIQAHVPNRYEV